MSNEPPSQGEVRGWLLNNIDVRDATMHYATEGMLSTADLWWLFEEHRIIAPAGAWLLAAMFEDQLPETLDEQMCDPGWWRWFDHGILDAGDQDR